MTQRSLAIACLTHQNLSGVQSGALQDWTIDLHVNQLMLPWLAVADSPSIGPPFLSRPEAAERSWPPRRVSAVRQWQGLSVGVSCSLLGLILTNITHATESVSTRCAVSFHTPADTHHLQPAGQVRTRSRAGCSAAGRKGDKPRRWADHSRVPQLGKGGAGLQAAELGGDHPPV